MFIPSIWRAQDVYENVVAQALVAGGYNLFYHTFLKEDGKHHHEVDFLIPSGKRICPIEVKSSSTTTHASLDAFVMKHRADVEMSVIVSTKNLKVEDGILFLPVYMMGLIDRI